MYRPTGLTSVAAILAVATPVLAQNRPAKPVTVATATTGEKSLPPIPYAEYSLANGLRVILHEDHSTPIVAVNVWYHVGSKNETPGKTGYAHLFEHMMFQGSKGYDDDYFKALQEVGGTLNGSTNTDRTNYWEVVPANFLERAVFLEADRMATLPDALTEAKLANQRDVVKNEKRQNYDNRPYGLAGAKISEILYPASHPYHWLTIGSLDDLTAASMEDIKSFFRRYYTPNNASLAIAGDFKPADARRFVEKYFGPIKRGPQVSLPVVTQPTINGTLRNGMQDRVSTPQITMVWHTVPSFTPDEAALDVLGAVLGQGRNSMLYKALVYDQQIAQQVTASNQTRELAGTFRITATPRRGVSVDSLEKAINEQIANILSKPVPASDIQRAYNANEANLIYSLQTIGGFGGKSDQLNQNAIFTGDPGFFERDLARYRTVTPAEVQRVAKKYLTDNRLIFTVTPLPRDAQTAQARGGQSAAVGATNDNDAGRSMGTTNNLNASLPQGGPDPSFSLPSIQRRKLSNGLDVLIVEHHELPVVTMNLVVRGGASADPQDRPGLATVTADLLDEGTLSRNALELSDRLASIGANLFSSADWDANNVTMTTLTRHLGTALGLFSDVLLHPAFRDNDINRIRQSRLQGLVQARDDATTIAQRVYASLLYGPGHPYGHAQSGTQESITAINAGDLRSYYDKYYKPNNSTLVIVGDIKPDAIVAQLENALAAWKPGDVPTVDLNAKPATRERTTIYLVDRPGAAQSVINIGQIGAPRSTPDYFTRLVLNQILGGAFVSRVNLNLREAKGYTYGARTVFDYRRGAGPFTASAGVQTAVTKESVSEFLKELRGIRGDIPITENELNQAKESLIRGFPRTFETPGQIAARLADVALYGLPDNYFNSYIAGIRNVTAADVTRVANAAVDPSHLAILVVGDRSVVEAGLKSLEGIGATVTVLDADGRPVSTSSNQ